MTRSTSYFSLYAGSPTDTNIKLVVQLAILSQKNVQETYKTEYLHECIMGHLNDKNISLQCFDTVGWASGRASGL